MSLKEKINKLEVKVATIYLCLKSEYTPWYAKFFAFLTISYALSPIDLIPDFIPILGYVDDIIILPFLCFITLKLIPKDVIQRYEDKAKTLFDNGKPKKWYYSIGIILIWVLIIGLIIYLILK